jgi:hypothetical protein
MAARNPEARRLAARAGGYAKYGNTAEAEATRRELAAVRLNDYIEKVVAAAPTLSAEQKQSLTRVLWGAQ